MDKVYIVECCYGYEGSHLLSIHRTLESANSMAKRRALGNWRVQDGCPYTKTVDENGCKTYRIYDISYVVTMIEVQE